MNDIETIITDEKYNLELKEQVNFDEPKKYLKAVSSFANGYDIGYIIFGIEDGTKKIVGVKDYNIEKEDLESFGLLNGEKLTNAALLYSD